MSSLSPQTQPSSKSSTQLLGFSPSDISIGLALVAAAIAAVFSVFGFIFTPRDSVLMTLLTLIVGHLMLASHAQRERDDQLKKVLSNVERRVGNSVAVAIDYRELEPFDQRVRNRQALWVHGPTLHDFMAAHWQTLEGLLENGVRMKFLIGADNDKLVGHLVTYFGTEQREPEDYRAAINSTKRRVAKWIVKYPALVEGRQFDIFPAHNILILNPESSDEEAQLHTNVFQRSKGRAPIVVFRNLEFGDECQCLRQEFKDIWNAAQPFGVSANDQAKETLARSV